MADGAKTAVLCQPFCLAFVPLFCSIFHEPILAYPF
jgi:hypothetical protein